MPKANGKLRPLGIPPLRDRVCMTAAVLVLEPIFGAPGDRQGVNSESLLQ
jgi:retron-type reverse transcriptase